MPTLRPYQVEATRQAARGILSHRAVLVVMATGSGKTPVAANLIGQLADKRVLYLAHRGELLDQAQKQIHRWTGIWPGREQAQMTVGKRRPRVVCAMVQTISREKRLGKYIDGDFDLVIVDEAHRAAARTYNLIFDHFPSARMVGMTATPVRGDGVSLRSVFENVAYELQLMPATEQAWLVPFRHKTLTVRSLDFGDLKSQDGDFQKGELSRRLSQEKIIHEMLAPSMDQVQGLQTLIFCTDVAHAQKLHGILNYRYAPGKSSCVHGDTPDEIRRESIRRFQEGDIQFLVNCDLFIEGIDLDRVGALMMCRSTKSLNRYMQMLGRGSRPLGGLLDGYEHSSIEERKRLIQNSAKPDCLVLDFHGNVGRHRLATVYDALAGKILSQEELLRASNFRPPDDKGNPLGITAEEAMKMSLAAQALWEEEQARLKSLRAIGGDWSWQEVVPGMEAGGNVSVYEEPCMERTAWAVYYAMGRKYPISWCRSLSARKASAILNGQRRSS